MDPGVESKSGRHIVWQVELPDGVIGLALLVELGEHRLALFRRDRDSRQSGCLVDHVSGDFLLPLSGSQRVEGAGKEARSNTSSGADKQKLPDGSRKLSGLEYSEQFGKSQASSAFWRLAFRVPSLAFGVKGAGLATVSPIWTDRLP